MSGVSFEDYRSQCAMRSAVEREIIIVVRSLGLSASSMRSCLAPCPILVQSLIGETCLHMAMEELVTITFSGLSTQA